MADTNTIVRIEQFRQERAAALGVRDAARLADLQDQLEDLMRQAHAITKEIIAIEDRVKARGTPE